MTNFNDDYDYAILIYKKEDGGKYNAAIKALTETKGLNGWDSVQGVTANKDCKIPSIYHGEYLAIVMTRYNGEGKYSLKVMY